MIYGKIKQKIIGWPSLKKRLEQAVQNKNIRPSQLAKPTGFGEDAISQYGNVTVPFVGLLVPATLFFAI